MRDTNSRLSLGAECRAPRQTRSRRYPARRTRPSVTNGTIFGQDGPNPGLLIDHQDRNRLFRGHPKQGRTMKVPAPAVTQRYRELRSHP